MKEGDKKPCLVGLRAHGVVLEPSLPDQEAGVDSAELASGSLTCRCLNSSELATITVTCI